MLLFSHREVAVRTCVIFYDRLDTCIGVLFSDECTSHCKSQSSILALIPVCTQPASISLHRKDDEPASSPTCISKVPPPRPGGAHAQHREIMRGLRNSPSVRPPTRPLRWPALARFSGVCPLSNNTSGLLFLGAPNSLRPWNLGALVFAVLRQRPA